MEISKSYDSLPYPSKFFVQTHPDRLAALASLFGINSKAPEMCRLLELGCGNGSNLISHAYNLQDSKFIGVDISGKHIEEANKTVKKLNLSNIEFYEADVMEMTSEEFGKFDYITAHGLISWIPDFVRQKVFELYNEMLEPNGIGYISYNAYPGAHYREMIRKMMRFHTKDIEEPVEKVQKAITFLSFLTENSIEQKVYQPTLEKELERHFKRKTGDIYHDDLAEVYQPYYFHEFVSILKKNNLQFLSEAELHVMSPKSFSLEVQNFVKDMDNIIEKEQYLDFLRGRSFRQSLICHKDVEIDRNIVPSSLDNFLLSSSIKPNNKDVNLAEPKVEKFASNKDFGIEIDHPLTKAALIVLGDTWGNAIDLKTLLQKARQMIVKQGFETDDWEKQNDITKAILLQLIQGTDMIGLHKYRPNPSQIQSDKPQINDLARWQIETGNTITTLFGINLAIEDEVSDHFIKLLDGTRNKENLKQQVGEYINKSESVEGKKELLDNLENWVNESLSDLAKLGLFVS